MKDYTEQLAKNSSRVKWITGGLVLILFLLLAFVFFKMFKDLKGDVARLTEQNMKLNVAKERAEELAHFKTQFESLSISYDSLLSTQVALTFEIASFSQNMKESLFDFFTKDTNGISSGNIYHRGKKMKKYNLHDWLPNTDTARLQEILRDVEWYRREFEGFKRSILTSNDRYAISIIYFKSYEQQMNMANEILQTDSTLAILKTEEMNKFTYNPKVVYFSDNDTTINKANDLSILLSKQLGLEFSVEKSNFAAHKRSIEIWIGKENKKLEKELLMRQISIN